MRWGVTDLKGLREAVLDLSPGQLTVLTGINSSGKSSALQSVLLAAQSLYHDGPIILNGPLVRLGDATDLVREGSESGTVTLSFDFAQDDPEDASAVADLRTRLELAPTDDRKTLRAIRIEVSATEGTETSLVLDVINARNSDVELARRATRREDATFLHLKSLMGVESRTLRTYVAMLGLRPIEVIQLRSPAEIRKQYREAIEYFLEDAMLVALPRSVARGRQGNVFAPALREFVRLVSRDEVSDPGLRNRIHALRPARAGNPYAFEEAWREYSSEEQQELIELAVEARGEEPWIRIPISSSYATSVSRRGTLLERGLDSRLEGNIQILGGVALALGNLANRVEYLGPLRDEPRVVWTQWNELARGLPVGTRGEFSAMVLAQSGVRHVSYVNPSGQRVGRTLLKAVNEWLAHLTIGDSITASHLGKLGVGLKLSMGGNQRDFTAVGVGVSQAIPLVVAVLSAPPDSIFIVEQPELHLHPAVQARLADFMLVARPDLAFVVETHSDSFVTRIRRRVAEGVVDPERVRVTFVEPGPGGASTRELHVTKYGDLSEWPDGFLSSLEEDTTAILRANVTRMNKADAEG